MKPFKFIIGSLILLFLGMYLPSALYATTVRGLYCDITNPTEPFDPENSILGNKSKEKELLSFAQKHQITYLCINDSIIAAYLGSGWSHDDDVASFFELAKTEYGIKEIGVSGGRKSHFENFISYNQNHTAAQIDVFSTECHYWSGAVCPCLEETAEGNGFPFDEYKCLLQFMKQKADEHGLKVDAFLGRLGNFPNEPQLLYKNTTRVLFNDYRKMDNYPVQLDQVTGQILFDEPFRTLFSGFADLDQPIKVWPTFSVEPSYMLTWFKKKSSIDQAMQAVEERFLQEVNESDSELKPKIEVEGFIYYKYSHMNYNEKVRFFTGSHMLLLMD